VAWFGVRSFWGHLQHFIASAIATEDIDCRDWMTPDEPRSLAERIGRILGGTGIGSSVSERLGRDVWIDYVADTGDDVAVSRAVARLLFRDYLLPHPDRRSTELQAPRGDILLFGGDTAYPVATADEIRARVIDPFNQVLAERDDGRRRILLGIPGNHDWYDGLDGFARMFRRHVDYDAEGRERGTLHGGHRTMLGHYVEWAREFVRGGRVEKPRTLDLIGYTAVQSASYFVLPLAPGLPMLAVDRQLKSIDARQAQFFVSWLNQHLTVTPWLVLPDPVYPFGVASPTGTGMVNTLGLNPLGRPHFLLAGDIHHYRREREGPSLHVVAGGGGAFLHPAPVRTSRTRPADVEWPTLLQSRALLRQVAWKVALGRSGILPHVAIAFLLAPVVLLNAQPLFALIAAVLAAITQTTVLALIGGARQRKAPIGLAAATTVLTCGAALGLGAASSLVPVSDWLPGIALLALQLAAGVMFGTYLFGAYLALLTRLGYEHTQAFTALDHPGFKHFVRFRVRADGSAVDGWCLGLIDPVNTSSEPVLVDAFTWRCR
jgi:hypothetical protein